MQKKKTLSLIICFSFILLIYTNIKTYATSDGASYVSAFYFSKEKNSIYFIRELGGGKNCTQFVKLNLKIEKEEKILSEDCTNSNQNNIFDFLPTDALSLKEVSLQKLGLEGNVKLKDEVPNNEYRGENKMPDIIDPFTSLSWNINLILKNQTVKSYNIFKCLNYNQNVNLRGYTIENEKFLVIVSTFIGKCTEHGYLDETVNVIQNTNFTKINFLKDIHNPIIPKGKTENEFCCPLGTKIFPSSEGIFISFSSINQKELNDLGFQSYQKRRYTEAMALFYKAHILDKKYLMPLYNLAATQSKLGLWDHAFKNIETILFEDKSGIYLTKMLNDSDFKEIRSLLKLVYYIKVSIYSDQIHLVYKIICLFL